jgi:hypothetical protein
MRVFAENYALSLEPNPLKTEFLKWQCRVRQIVMRENNGKPDDAVVPSLFFDLSSEPIGSIITIFHRLPQHSLVAELFHLAKKTFDPAQRREQAVKLLSAHYYQKHSQFSDLLTATFLPNSKGASKIIQKRNCTLVFEAFSKRFEIICHVSQLTEKDYLYQSTIAHNQLFNPNLHPSTKILCFEPNWIKSVSSNG